MVRIKAYTPSTRIAVRESIDEDLSDDVEDDVFIRDGKSFKVSEENGLKRPLMAPRRRNGTKSTSSRTANSRKTVAAFFRQKNRCWKYCEPFCYAFAALLVLVALIFLAAFLLTMFPVSLQKMKTFFRDSNFIGHTFSSRYGNDLAMEYRLFSNGLTPCTQITVNMIWSKAYAKLGTEGPVRKFDINGDSIQDIIFGYGVDDNANYPSERGSTMPKCELETAGYRKMIYCRGGILAVDGATGIAFWQRWTSFPIFSLFCNADLNLDGQIDCVASGGGALVVAINGKTGDVLWHLKENVMLSEASARTMTTQNDLYTVNGIRDVDEDSISDILAVHEEDRQAHGRTTGSHILIISGQSGKIIRTIPTPNQEELYVPIQVITQYDGTERILVVTGGQDSPGGVYLISLLTIMDYSKETEFITIYRNATSGFMVPAVLADLNEDGIDDIIVSLFTSIVLAFDGKSYTMLWQYVFPESESISSIVPGHYNNDNITDFMVKYNCGPGFPVYYYSQTQIINGKDGSALLDRKINDSGGANTLLGGISISQTFGGDFFLHWQAQCRGKYDVKDPYQFVPGSDISQQSRADTCMLRYNTSSVLKLFAITRHIQSPGAIIFSTDDLLLQLNQTELKQLAKQMAVSPFKHPKMLMKLLPKQEIGEQNNKTINTVNTTMNNKNVKITKQSAKKVEDIRNTITIDNNDNKQKSRKKLIKTIDNTNEIPYDVVDNQIERPIFNEAQINRMELPLASNIESNTDNDIVANRQKQFKNYILNNRYGVLPYIEEQMDQQPLDLSDEYPTYDDEAAAAERRSNYGTSNRDVRSKENVDEIYSDSKINESLDAKSVISNNISNDLVKDANIVNKDMTKDPETLWDLEIEKENEDDIKDSKLSALNENDNRRRRRQIEIPFINKNLLPIIASTGVLLKPLDNAPSTLDLVFVLNVRESELYPPLFLAEDLKCVEEKLGIYQNEYSSDYARANIEAVEKQFVEQCIQQRLPNLEMQRTQFESQVVVTRISIKCSCGSLTADEKCSKFNPIDKQKWTEFMGNLNNGFY